MEATVQVVSHRLALEEGRTRIAEIGGQDMDVPMTLKAGPYGQRPCRPSPMVMAGEAVRVLTSRTSMFVFENAMQVLIVELWLQFLRDAYRDAVRHHVTGATPSIWLGDKGFGLRPIRGQFAGTAEPLALADAVADAAAEHFSFSEAPKRATELAKVLGREVWPNPVETQRHHVLMRNIIVHNAGVVRETDAKKAGGVFRIKDRRGKRIEVRAGDRVVLSVWDLLELIPELQRLADQLAGDPFTALAVQHAHVGLRVAGPRADATVAVLEDDGAFTWRWRASVPIGAIQESESPPGTVFPDAGAARMAGVAAVRAAEVAAGWAPERAPPKP